MTDNGAADTSTSAGDALSRARSGDGAAFAELVDRYRRELHVHCYRMLGSFDEADDAVQETLLAAWRGIAAFRGHSSVRTWLYHVATNTCLNLARTATRRPQMIHPLPSTAPTPTGMDTVTWLQPYPDSLLDDLPSAGLGPHAQLEQHEAVSLAFVTALQLLSPRARAVLILRDVLGMSAREVAHTLGSTEAAVAMMLSRARASLESSSRGPTRFPSADEMMLARRLAVALTEHDISTVTALLTDDVRVAMPPLPAVWEGQQAATEFVSEVAFRLVPEARFVETRANRQPALAVYSRDTTSGLWRGSGLLVITPRGDRVAALTRFESHALSAFGLPDVLSDS